MSAPHSSSRPLPGPQRFQQMHFSFAAERVLSASLQLNVFSTIAAGKQSATEIAAATGASERGMRMLLNALVAFELLGKRDGAYELTADAERYLVRESPDYMGAMFESDEMWDTWKNLAEAVRLGASPRSINRHEVAEAFFPTLIRTLHISNREPARRLAAQIVRPGATAGLRVLDIGCGSGVWSLAVAAADPEARVVALDLPKVLESTRRFVAAESMSERYEFIPGDFQDFEYPAGKFDLAILGNIVHAENETRTRRLFSQIHRALGPAGRLAIIDMIPNEERTGPPFPVLFALNMLLHTDEGNTYTMSQYGNWLAGAGFAGVETVDIASHSPAIVATKS
ncbi:MAG TPA: class I SAM-dependent methyltransferase [Candidatus Dormibacteraeota bacterium]|nr:class I SAM-dependent methyltransferase [Candidatus Dormibacteraeota bacterium]